MKTCYLCKKGSLVVGSYSNRVRATKYNPTGKKRKKPNLQWAFMEDGQRQLICSSCHKRMAKDCQ